MMLQLPKGKASGTMVLLLWTALAVTADSQEGSAHPEVLTVRTEGVAMGTGPAARETAIENAQQTIIADVVESMVSSRDLSLFEPIIEHASQYVRSFQVLRTQVKDGATYVRIEAYVAAARLRRDIGALALPALPQQPRILLLIAERMPGDEGPSVSRSHIAEDALTEILGEAHLEPMNGQVIRSRYPGEKLLEAACGDPEQAALLAHRNLADVAVVGEAVCESTQQGRAGVRRNQARVRIRVVRAGDCTVFEDTTTQAVAYSLDPRTGTEGALRDACAKLREPLVLGIVIAALGVNRSDDVIITLENLGSRAELAEICDVINDFPAVEGVEELYVSPPDARLRVAYDGLMAPFVDTLMDTAYSGFRVEAPRAIGREVTLRVIR